MCFAQNDRAGIAAIALALAACFVADAADARAIGGYDCKVSDHNIEFEFITEIAAGRYSNVLVRVNGSFQSRSNLVGAASKPLPLSVKQVRWQITGNNRIALRLGLPHGRNGIVLAIDTRASPADKFQFNGTYSLSGAKTAIGAITCHREF